MKLIRIFVVFLSLFFVFGIQSSYAVVNPLEKKNNFVGIHILFPSELDQAKDLINSSGGDWGYVTIPIQITDRDLVKWQLFMDQCANNHIIPILRIATEPYYANTNVWRRPSDLDIIDQANFLDSLNWPTKNRYVIVFNEMNRFDEWGGRAPSPEEYAEVLMYTYDVFKRRNSDFYIIMGGLDNAAPNDGKHLSYTQYLERMYAHNTDVFNKMDGFSSHSYPNPGFTAAPGTGRMSVGTYKYEYDYINARANSKKLAFITETGWDSAALGQTKVASYWKQTYDEIWKADSDKIVAITPFLLTAVGGPFDKFSFIKNGQTTEYYKTVKSMSKTKGEPVMAPLKVPLIQTHTQLIEKDFDKDPEYIEPNPQMATKALRMYAKAVLGIHN